MNYHKSISSGPPVAASHRVAVALQQQQQQQYRTGGTGSSYNAWLDRTRQSGAQDDPDRPYFLRSLDRLDSQEESDADDISDSEDPHYRPFVDERGAGYDEDGYGDDDGRPDGPWLIGGQGTQAPYVEQPVRSYDVLKQTAASDGAPSDGSTTDDDGDSTSSEQSLGPEATERLEWQSMLDNVLQGEVLKTEKERLSGSGMWQHPFDDVIAKKLFHSQQVYVGVRAFVRARDIEHEQRYLEEARNAVDDVIADVSRFKASEGVSEAQAAEEVSTLLRRVQWAISLYPSIKALTSDKPAWAQADFQHRFAALQSWATITQRLSVQMGILRKWTGSHDLNMTQPINEPIESEKVAEPSLDGGSAVQQANDPKKRTTADLLDRSTFIERILKDNSIERTFQKGTLTDVYPLVSAAKYTIIENYEQFVQMNLPAFSDTLAALLKFPVNLMMEAVRVQLDMGQRAPKDDPSMALIDQLTEDFRACIRISTKLKQEFVALIAPDSERGWTPPELSSIRAEFHEVIEEALKFFFKLLHWKLKSGSKAIYLKETEIVEAEWRFLIEATESMEGADLLVGEHFSMIIHRLIYRVLGYFEETLQSLIKRKGSVTDTSRWFSQTLDNVRQRSRKLFRFGMSMIQRFENSAEYYLDDIDLGAWVSALADSNHFLVYTGTMEQQGTYVIGSPALHDRHDLVQRILTRTFNPDAVIAGGFGPSVRDMPENASIHEYQDGGARPNVEPTYLLVITPREPFIWTGRVMNCQIKSLDFDTRERRVRLVADGPLSFLVAAKRRLYSQFPAFREVVASEAMAHIARVNREIKKIKTNQYRFVQNIVAACDRVTDVARGMEGAEGLLAAYYTFAAETSSRSLRPLEPKYKARLTPMLMLFGIRWVNFICEDCIPSDSRTFKWAVQALEFVRTTTQHDNILKLSPEEYAHLRSGVASCVALLISHFDVLGARSSVEAKKEKGKLDAARQEARRMLAAKLADMRAAGIVAADMASTTSPSLNRNSSLKLVSDRLSKQVEEIEGHRKEVEAEMRIVGRVLDTGRPEDQGLLFLASSSSNISIRWQQGRFIGGGTFGQVYLGVNLDSGDLMAVKEIRFQDLASAPTLIKQVRDEMRVMEMLRHPHIVEYYGIEVHRDKVYIFEEYCQGGSLASLLEHGRIEDEAVLQLYTLQLLDGLVYLHSEHVIHRDIKPDNILLDHQGTIKYVDFGAAKVLNKQKRTMQRTRMGDAVNNSLTGTPSYMAPETIKGQIVGPEGAMDVWSLGCVVLECATGKRPWSELDNEWAIMFQIGIAAKPPPLPEENQLSALGIDFIRQCLIIDANERPTAAYLRDRDPWILDFEEQMAREYAEEVPDGDGETASSSLSSGATVPLFLEASPQGSLSLDAPSVDLPKGALTTVGEEAEEE